MRSIRQTKITAAVAAALSALMGASVASAQFRVGQDGHASDASNRIGSGGINQGGSPSNQLVTGNDIVLGNVTGGRQFRGNVGYTDPLAFRGVLPGSGIDAFTRDSSGVPLPNQPAFGLTTPRAFFGDARGVAPPIGSVREGFTGSYVGTSLTPTDPYSSFLTGSSYANVRLGNTTISSPQSNDQLQPSVRALPGSLESSGGSDLTGSPLYGLRQAPGAPGAGDAYIADRYNALHPGAAALAAPDAQAIRQMQTELNNPDPSVLTSGRITNAVSNNPTDLAAPSIPGNPGNQATPGDPNSTPGNNAAQPNGQPGGINDNRTLGSRPLQQGINLNGRSALTNAPITNSLSDQPLSSSTTDQLQLPPAGQQSSQVAAMNSRLEAYRQTHPMSTYERLQQARQDQAGRFAKGGTTRPSGKTGATTKPTGAAATNPGDAAAQQGPVQVGSLATGIQAKGLHDLMASAEDLMRQGQFQPAIMKYRQAERVVPNNPLPTLGRAQAEMAAGYYVKAETDLRHVFSTQPATLMAQYDLKKQLSPQRLELLTKDLTDLAKKDNAERSWFLLAYIAYNTGDNAAASRYLAEAEQRAPGDPILQSMRDHWSLPKTGPTTAPTPELNK